MRRCESERGGEQLRSGQQPVHPGDSGGWRQPHGEADWLDRDRLDAVSSCRDARPVTAIGCGDTPTNAVTPPAWAGNVPAGLPILMSRNANVTAVVFGAPLGVHKPAYGPANNILWIVRQPREGSPLSIDGHRLGETAPVVSLSLPADSGPGEIYPSIVNVSAPGCWAFTLRWASDLDTIDLLYG